MKQYIDIIEKKLESIEMMYIITNKNTPILNDYSRVYRMSDSIFWRYFIFKVDINTFSITANCLRVFSKQFNSFKTIIFENPKYFEFSADTHTIQFNSITYNNIDLIMSLIIQSLERC